MMSHVEVLISQLVWSELLRLELQRGARDNHSCLLAERVGLDLWAPVSRSLRAQRPRLLPLPHYQEPGPDARDGGAVSHDAFGVNRHRSTV